MAEPRRPRSAARPLPDKRYFTIGEVSHLCGVKDHVLRYWERKFPQLRPDRRQGRRYYRRDDVMTVRKIQDLLQRGYTVDGAARKLHAPEIEPGAMPALELRQMAADLERVVELLKQ